MIIHSNLCLVACHVALSRDNSSGKCEVNSSGSICAKYFYKKYFALMDPELNMFNGTLYIK